MSILIAIVVIYLFIHLIGGLFHHRIRSRRGHRVNIGWSLLRGPWASVRVGRHGTFYEHL